MVWAETAATARIEEARMDLNCILTGGGGLLVVVVVVGRVDLIRAEYVSIYNRVLRSEFSERRDRKRNRSRCVDRREGGKGADVQSSLIHSGLAGVEGVVVEGMDGWWWRGWVGWGRRHRERERLLAAGCMSLDGPPYEPRTHTPTITYAHTSHHIRGREGGGILYLDGFLWV